MKTSSTFTEYVTDSFSAVTAENVDEANGIIRGVKVCGLISQNKRRYPVDVLRRDFSKYENAKVYFDHKRGGRSIREQAGWLKNVKPGDDGTPRADLHLYTSDPGTAKVFEAAKRNPNQLGLSHVAKCRTRREGGVEVIEVIESVESVDLVTDPATVQGLFESRENPMKYTLKTLSESFGPKWGPLKWGRFEKVVEDMGDMSSAPVANVDDSSSPEDALKGGFKAAVHAVVDDDSMDMKAKMDKIKKILQAQEKLLNDKSDDEGDEGEEGEGEEKPEGKKPGGNDSIREAIEVCRKVGFKGFDADDLELIATAPVARREAVAKRLKGTVAESKGGEKPQSHGQERRQESKSGSSTKSESTIPTDGKAAAKRYSTRH